MRKGLLAFSLLTALSLGGVVLASRQKEYLETKGYSSASLPTVIDLNDSTTSEIRSYYSSLNSLSKSERKGNNLLKNLKTILKNGQNYFSYENGTNIWKMYEITDRDWDLSPASSIASYNSSTNKITNYSYGSSLTNVGTNPYIRALYNNRNVTNQTRAWDSHGVRSDPWTIEREHVWPKSQGFDSSGAGGARGDPMHLMAANGTTNGLHSNLFYGYVDKTKSYTDSGTTHANTAGNLTGTSKTIGSNTVFEPQDSDKGDIARAVFYMVARYNYLSGSDSDGIDTDNPNLKLVQASQYASSYTSSTTKTGDMGVLTDLLAWHHADPVDAYEIHRNNLLYKNFTNNRNPFIDFPEWVDFIWGSASYSGTSYVSYDSTPTGAATPSSDTINGYNAGGGEGDDTVDVTGVTLNKSSLSLEVDGSEILTATVAPNNATNKNVTWSSSRPSVATVSNGTVTAVNAGNTTITVTTLDGGYTASCAVSVSGGSDPSSATGSVSASSGAFSDWTASGLDANGYKDGSAKFDSTGDYVYKNGIFSGDISNYMTSLTVTINGKINGTDSDDNSFKVEALNSNGSVIDSSTFTGKIGTSASDKIFVLSTNLSGCTGIKIKYDNKDSGNWGVYSISWSAEYEVPAQATSITASINRTYHVGETITKNHITVIDNYDKEVNDFTFANDGYRFTYSDASSGGELTDRNFTVTYGLLEASFTVQVSRVPYEELEEGSLDFIPSDFIDAEVSDSSGSPSTGTFTLAGTELYLNGVYVYNKSSISLSSGKYSAPGYFYNSEPLEEDIVSLSVGKNDSSPTPDIAVSADGSNWLDLSSVNTAKVSYRYFKIYYSNTDVSTYTNLTSIVINTITHQSAVNVANFIMYEDTNNQCLTKFDVAKDYFNNMTTVEKATFMTSEDYVIATARARLQAWATNQGKEIIVDDGEYVINPSSKALSYVTSNSDNSIVLIVALSFISIISIYAFVEKKKQEE